MAPYRISRTPRISRRWTERNAYFLLFGVVGFWILAVFVLVYHAMHVTTRPPIQALPPGQQLQQQQQPRKGQKESTFKSNVAAKSHLRAKATAVTAAAGNEPTKATLLRPYASPLIIFTCRRADYLTQALTKVVQYLPESCRIGCPIIISQDGYDADVARVISEFRDKYRDSIPIIHMQHEPNITAGAAGAGGLTEQQMGYRRLANHYGWALGRVFDGIPTRNSTSDNKNHDKYHYPKPDRVIILEEDLLISHDFFDYFAATAPLLDQVDGNLLSISAFNDNGKQEHVKDATRVLRSDFFPGLGWMMNRKLWDTELSSKWPAAYWDDWLREPQQRRGRHILRPEVSRTFHFGFKGGTSKNQFGDNLKGIHLNDQVVRWSEINLSTLEESAYDQSYFSVISNAQPVKNVDEALQTCLTRDARLEYGTLHEFKLLANKLRIMNDEKAGIPRTAYRGVVEIRPHGNFLLFLIPPFETLESTFQAPHHDS